MALTAGQSSRLRGKAGALRTYLGTDQAANTEFSESVPSGAVWELLAVRATLVTDANVANRQASLILDDGTNTFCTSYPVSNHAASTTVVYNWVTELGASYTTVTTNVQLLPLPKILLGPGFRVRSSTASIQVGDNWGVPAFLVVEYDL